jgi:flagellar motility protein MotE (MotC chaperone)
MIRILQSPWSASFLGTVAYLATLVVCWRPVALPPAPAAARHGLPGPGASWVFSNPEIDLLMSELRSQKEALGAKERDLTELSARLQSERAELSQLTKSIERVQADFDQNVTRVRQEEEANLKKLAKMYATMTPEGATTIFKALDDATIVKIMTLMKDSESAPVLELMARQSEAEAKRVAGISERLRLSFTETKKPAARQ